MGPKFTFDAVGFALPVGNTVRNDPVVPLVTVTFNATAPTPVAGTPPRPSTDSFMVWPAPSFPAPEPCPSTVVAPGRVSNKRAGAND